MGFVNVMQSCELADSEPLARTDTLGRGAWPDLPTKALLALRDRTVCILASLLLVGRAGGE
jgi:hypothetical protein